MIQRCTRVWCFKLHHAIKKAHYLGLERNKTSVMQTAMTYNIKRGANIKSGMYV